MTKSTPPEPAKPQASADFLHRSCWVVMWIVFVLGLAGCTSNPTGSPENERPGESTRVGTEWTEVSGNPILDPPACPAWNCLGMTDPWIGTSASGEPLLWVSAGGSAAEGGPVVGRAAETPGGAFQFDGSAPQIVPRDSVWDRWRETVSFTFDDNTDRWSMWYLGYADSFFDDPAIGRAISEDPEGLRFPRSPAPLYRPSPDGWDAAFLTDPVPVRRPDGGWNLYYVGAGTTIGVGLLTSPNGEHWTPHPQNPVFERDLSGWDQGLLGIEVKRVDDQYLMWYTGYREPLDLETTPMSIGLAVSDDGIRWTRVASNPVIEPGTPEAWNGLRVVSPSVWIQNDGSLVMAVHGQSRDDARGSVLGRIGLYRSESPE